MLLRLSMEYLFQKNNKVNRGIWDMKEAKNELMQFVGGVIMLVVGLYKIGRASCRERV